MNRRGLTLVELLITVSLMALTAGVTVSALAGGVKVWRQANAVGTQRQAALVAFIKVQHDLRNARTFTPLPFIGRAREVSFAAVEPDPPGADVAELGRLGYYVDTRAHQLCRSFVPYRRAHLVRLQGRCRAVLDGVDAVQFGYAADGPEIAWSESWDDPYPPAAIRVTVRMQTGAEGSRTRIVALPMGRQQPRDHE